MKKIDYLLFFAPIGTVVFAWVASWWLITENSQLATWAERGAFGDMFGAVNSLFSGLAFSGLLLALYLQTQQLSLQRQELMRTQAELQRQNETRIIENFENTFFQLLGFHHTVVDSLDLEVDGQSITERDYFTHIYSSFANDIDRTWTPKTPHEYIEQINNVFNRTFVKHQTDLGHYFRTLQTLFKYIDLSRVENKKFYVELLQSQLSDFELLVIFYYALSDLGDSSFKLLIEKYGLFRTLPVEHVVMPEHMMLYEKIAFE